MSYQDLVNAATQIPEFDLDELRDPDCDDRARTMLQNCRPALASARAAMATRPAVPTEFTSQYFNHHTSRLPSARQLARAFQLEAFLADRDGDLEHSMACGLDLVHLVHCQRRHGLIVDLLVSVATWVAGTSSLASLRKRLTRDQRAKLIRLLIESEAECEPSTTIIARDALWTAIVELPPFDEQSFRASFGPEFTEEEIDAFVEMERLAENAPPSSSQQHCFDASDRALAYQRLLAIELAIDSYGEVHSEPPPSLETLVPAFLLARLPDPFTNANFIYRVDKDEHLLYSVGPKRQDLGGVRGDWVEVSMGAADMFLD